MASWLFLTAFRHSPHGYACVASFSLLLVFYEAIQWFHADGNFIFAPDFQETETKLSEISSEIMTLLRLSQRQSGL